ncbi:hypothetical protein IQ07DRAFT_590637 [Pyrenochaeta sp. DS3sAY3a]|nr:hypothetical protein IQ07DRAFT_590637 [Pyrenochaeta sp. DS3sAY3a]
MSGAFETAAGAFAVVGVADVLVRTGRELYRFLSDVSDAPDEVKRLSECVRETILLVDALNKQAKTIVDAAIAASVQAAVKALNRELQSLKVVLAKLKGAKTTWSRIKYVLDEKKVLKTLNNLERSKSLLANSLNIIYGEISAVKFNENSTLITQVGTKVDALQTLALSLNTDCGVIKTKLDLHKRNIVDSQNSHQQALKSQLDDHHQQNQQNISALQLNQTSFSSSQQRLLETSSRTEKRLVLLQAKGKKASRSSAQDHLKTRALLRNEFETLHTALDKRAVKTKTSGNTVYFRGERVDMITSYLLPIKDEFNSLVNQILSQPHHGLPVEEILLLRIEIQRLLGSAAQEQAARYAMSTATSFDEWHFPGLKQESSPSEEKSQDGDAPENGQIIGTRSPIPEIRPKKRNKRKMQTLSFKTKSGQMKLHILQKKITGDGNINNYDVGLSFTNYQAQSFYIVDIRFTQYILPQMRPRICAELNVFVKVPDSLYHNHWMIFYDDSTIEEIDRAIRNGSVSPYYVDGRGFALLLKAATEYGRIDVLQYFESHGIGITGLRQDNSVYEGLTAISWEPPNRYHFAEDILRTFNYAEDLLYDSTGMAADLIIVLVVDSYGHRRFDNQHASFIDECLAKLHKNGYNCAHFKLGNISNLGEFRWSQQKLYELMALLFEAGAEPRKFGHFSGSHISELLYNHSDVQDRKRWALEDLLYVLVQIGVSIDGLTSRKWTISMTARYYDIWPIWCQALQDSGRNIDEVLRKEGTQWLLDDNWENVFAERYKAFGFRYYDSSEDYDEFDSDLETSDEDEDAESEGEGSDEENSGEEDSDEEKSDEEDSDNKNSDEEMDYDHDTGSSKINGGKAI